MESVTIYHDKEKLYSFVLVKDKHLIIGSYQEIAEMSANDIIEAIYQARRVDEFNELRKGVVH